MGEWLSKLRSLLTRSGLHDDLRAELDEHLQMEVDANLDRGMAREDALDAARRNLGNNTLIEESAREAWAFLWLETFLQDLRFALRLLRRSRGFTLTAVSVIALGIGATTAAFTLLDHVLLRPLPYPEPDQLVKLYETELSNGYSRIESSPPNVLDWRSMNKSFSSMGSYIGSSVTLSGQGEPRRLVGVYVDSTVFKTIGARPMVGRLFTAQDDQRGAANVVVLSSNLATTLFGHPTRALGRSVSLDDQMHIVIGVLPAGFAFPSREEELWRPLRFSPVLLALRSNHILDVVARLRPGISVKEARADMDVIAGQLQRAYPKDNAGIGIAVAELRDVMSPQSRLLVLAVFGAAFCLMLIACTNLANLLLARSMARRQEFAVRVAIGAGQGRLLRQLLTEGVVLASVGGVIGALLATTAVPLLARLVPNALPVSSVPEIDLRVLAFAAVATLATGLVFGVGPALRSWRYADPTALASRSKSGTPTDRLRSVLVLTEVAGTVTLLVGAGLLVKALWRVQAVDPGFRSEGVLTLQTPLPMPKYGESARRNEFYSRVLTQARALPGVTSAAYTTALPLVWGGGIQPVTVPGVADDPASAPKVSIRFVTHGFFTTLGIPLRRGRTISDRDNNTAPFIAVISESLVERLWPGQDPIGLQLNTAGHERTVVGVVGDITVRGLERVSEPQTYFPVEQLGKWSPFYAPRDLVIRTSGDVATLAPAVRRIIRDVDPSQAVANVRPLDEIVASQTASRRDQVTVLGAFAAIALILAAVGIYGLLSFTVSARTQEVGVRVALGAARGRILGMFLRQGLVLGVAGIAVAIPLAYAGARGMKALLFGVEPGDPVIYIAAASTALLVMLAGSLRPAFRAASIDPATTIRTE